MIEATHSLAIDTSINNVWDYVQDIRKWATLFPGCRECEVIDEHNSKWVIKIGAGGLIKTVNVLVHIEQWNGPERVNFSYQLENEPVIGGGSYIALRKSATETEITLTVRVEGSGPMAPMWEAVSKPLLPQLAKLFAGKLKSEIETVADSSLSLDSVSINSLSMFATLVNWFRNIWLHLVAGRANKK